MIRTSHLPYTAVIDSESSIALQDESTRKAAPGTMLDALHRRRTTREFSPEPLSMRQLSQLLWAAYGINRPSGLRTVPAAMEIYALKLFVFLAEGVYRYRAETDELELIEAGDFRHMAGTQEFVADAPINIAVYADYGAFVTGDAEVDDVLRGREDRIAALDAGAVAENIYLYCAAEDLNVVERIMMDDKAFAERFALPPTYHFQLAVTAGYSV